MEDAEKQQQQGSEGADDADGRKEGGGGGRSATRDGFPSGFSGYLRKEKKGAKFGASEVVHGEKQKKKKMRRVGILGASGRWMEENAVHLQCPFTQPSPDLHSSKETVGIPEMKDMERSRRTSGPVAAIPETRSPAHHQLGGGMPNGKLVAEEEEEDSSYYPELRSRLVMDCSSVLERARNRKKEEEEEEDAPSSSSSKKKVMMREEKKLRYGADHGFVSPSSRTKTQLQFARGEAFSNATTPSPSAMRTPTRHHIPTATAVAQAASLETRFENVDEHLVWTVVHPHGKKPEPRSYHAATIVGRKMLVTGGNTASGSTNDVQILHLGKMMWSGIVEAGPSTPTQGGMPKSVRRQRLPACKGHSMISWGKTVLLVAGDMDPIGDQTEVWSFDLQTRLWTKIAAKGEIPAARSGQSVTRAGSILIMFGGEDSKGHKMNDLHILDLKSLMWLPLHTTGTGPSPRSKHVAAMYDDRFLLIFGGVSKSKPLNDIYALDFETMEWSRLKNKGASPSPRAGHAGVLVGDKWYIVGGESRGFGVLDSLVLDIAKMTWSIAAIAPPNSVLANQGLSLVPFQRKGKIFLIAFGGYGNKASNEVQVLYIPPSEYSTPASPPRSSSSGLAAELSESRGSAAAAAASVVPYSSLRGAGIPCACVKVSKTQQQLPVIDHHHHSSPFRAMEDMSISGLIPLRKRFSLMHTAAGAAKETSIRQRDASSKSMEGSSSVMSTPSQDSKVSEAQYRDAENTFGEAAAVLASPKSSNMKKMKRLTNSSSRTQSSLEAMVFDSSEQTGSARRRSSASEANANTPTSRNTGYLSEAFRTTLDGNSDIELLMELQDADSVDQRTFLINRIQRKFEKKLAAAVRKNERTEGELAAAVRGKEEAEKNLASVLNSKQKMELRLASALEAEQELKDRVAAAEQAQEDSNNLCNVVHAENLRLEHDLAFLKAVVEDTQKELQTTRGVLAGERSRAFQLQVEIFELKQKLSTNDAPQLVSPLPPQG
ncbi:hypothetical protein CY35_01G126600 [Sphagnum magellanicum]|nr:hypothetical protein CY35_01G126600 [Sphagnum magellanicum]